VLSGFLTLLQRRFPIYLVLEVTSRCNLKCCHCFNWKRQDTIRADQELSLSEYEKLTDNLRKICYLSITGGEPTLRHDLPDIISLFCQKNHVQVINLHTNGFDPDTIISQISAIRNKCPKVFLRISVSIDDIDAIHDEIRGVAGSFQHAKTTIEKLAALKHHDPQMSVEIASVISSANLSTFSNIYPQLLNSLPVDLVNICLLRGDSRETAYKNVPLEQYESIIRFKNQYLNTYYPKNNLLARGQKALNQLTNLISIENLRQKTQVVPCRAGSKGIEISSTGEVFPCEMLDKTFGNLRDHNFNIDEMLHSQPGKEIRRFIKGKNCYCSFECMIPLSIIYSPRHYPRLLNYMFR